MSDGFKVGAMQLRRPRKHSNFAIVRNFAQKILRSKAPPMTAEQIRQQGAKLAFKLFP